MFERVRVLNTPLASTKKKFSADEVVSLHELETLSYDLELSDDEGETEAVPEFVTFLDKFRDM